MSEEKFSELLRGLYSSSSDERSQSSPQSPPISRSELRSVLIRLDALEHRVQELSDAVRAVLDSCGGGSVDVLLSRLDRLESVLSEIDARLKRVEDSDLVSVARGLSDVLFRLEQQIVGARSDISDLLKLYTLLLPLETFFEKVGKLSEQELANIQFSGAFTFLLGSDGGWRLVDRYGNVYRVDPDRIPDWFVRLFGVPLTSDFSKMGVANPLRRDWSRPNKVRRSRKRGGGEGSA